tara:strand:- start:1130 stop:1423 length:294 start_codon:yes stop_codon:yes gene_type:complete
MLKALMIVSALSGDYQIPMENMDACFKAKVEVVKQDKDVKVLCIPRADKHQESHQKMENMFNFFMGFVSRLQQEQQDFCFENPLNEACDVVEKNGLR